MFECTGKKVKKEKSQKRSISRTKFNFRNRSMSESKREWERATEWNGNQKWFGQKSCDAFDKVHGLWKHVCNVNITCGDPVLFARTKTFRVAHHLVYVLINVFVYQARQSCGGWLAAASSFYLFLFIFSKSNNMHIHNRQDTHTRTRTNIRTLCMRVHEKARASESESEQESGKRSEISPLENFIIVIKQSTPNLSLHATTLQYSAHHTIW